MMSLILVCNFNPYFLVPVVSVWMSILIYLLHNTTEEKNRFIYEAKLCLFVNFSDQSIFLYISEKYMFIVTCLSVI